MTPERMREVIIDALAAHPVPAVKHLDGYAIVAETVADIVVAAILKAEA